MSGSPRLNWFARALDASLERTARRALKRGAWPGYDERLHALVFREASSANLRRFGRRLLGWQIAGCAALAIAFVAESLAYRRSGDATLVTLLFALGGPFLLGWFAARRVFRSRAGRAVAADLPSLPLAPSRVATMAMAPASAAVGAGATWFAALAVVEVVYWSRPWRWYAQGFELAAALAIWFLVVCATLAAVAWRMAPMAPLAGRTLALRRGGGVGGFLALAYAARLAAGLWLFLSGPFLLFPMWRLANWSSPWDALHIFLGVLAAGALLIHSSDLGFFLPREWAAEDDAAIDRAGPEALFGEEPIERVAFWRTLWRIAWPSPTPSRRWPVLYSPRSVAESWRGADAGES